GLGSTTALVGLANGLAAGQLPDQGNSLLHSSRCGAGAQQALQIHQLFARQFGKSKDAAHADRVALTTPQVKSTIAIFMNKTTSPHRGSLFPSSYPPRLVSIRSTATELPSPPDVCRLKIAPLFCRRLT